ncbi:zinc finger protein ZAT4-like [Cucumis melo var. makuwa]|uniref:Zinc finger protein ZAT4-like n=1 Tax=Cucumis melo var. makuwa TaxID=1194695 RepID=A0A5A7TCS9_CUCMM|nr:zinc finger protein ZAT4-like [Cucumis melo var. makuwa]TYK12028.1 zinc finger protein ZAT4-like [Cucumis melo var. makuwa]
MEDERHKCRLCSRSFTNGRALGGHMKAHLATFSIEHQKTFKSPDLEMVSVNGSISIVQDRESETESKNPTRRRSKRTRRFNTESLPSPSPSPEPASSISDTSPEEDVAICLVMLSMEKPSSWKDQSRTPESEKSTAAMVGRVRKSFRCGKCRKTFRSNRALFGHRKVCRKEGEEEDGEEEEEKGMVNGGNWKIFKCPYCCKVFGSGQALGGHKRSHLQGSIRTAIDGSSSKLEIGLDLNLPAPLEEDDYSVVSDV